MLAARSRIGQCWRSLSWIQQQQQQRTFSAASKSAAAVETPTSAATPEAVDAHSHSPEASTSTWTPESQRTGVLAKKLGMTAIYDSAGVRTPVTVLQLEQVAVTAVRTTPYHAVQVGIKDRSPKNVHNGLLGQFRKNNVNPKYQLAEFKVTEDALLEPGTDISAAHFVPGQFVDVQGKTIGKGFQGVMKRWGFKGLRASHGVSISHRSHGSTGQHQDPGRVFPGKKMAGHMGNRLRTLQNLLVMRVDTSENLVFLRGSIPGPPGKFVRVSDSIKKCVSKARERKRRTELGISDTPLPGIGNGVNSLPFPACTPQMVKQLGLPSSILYNNEKKQ